MKKEIKLIKRKPTFEYILNDLAFESLKFNVIHGVASNQEKFDFDYQLKLKDKMIEDLQRKFEKIQLLIDVHYQKGYIPEHTKIKIENIMNGSDENE